MAPRVLNIRNCSDRRIPDGAVYIGRIEGSKWGNPFKPTKQGDAEAHAVAVARYRQWICDQPELMAALPELRGRDLVCWCRPLPCHGDVLPMLANPSTIALAGSLDHQEARRPSGDV